MIEFFFLLCWSGIFISAAYRVWKRINSHIKVYLILILHFLFLSGIFYLYPLVLNMTKKL